MKVSRPQSRPLRSQPTRDRILEAARAIFGRDGYDRATIRGIAAEANINPAMVMRYYGNKESLFAAVTELRKLDTADFSGTPKSRLGEAMVRDVLKSWDDPRSGSAQRAMFIAAASSEAARAKWMRYRDQYVALLEPHASKPLASDATALLRSQLNGLVLARYVLRLPEAVAIPSETLIREVGRVVQSYIDRA